MKAIPRSIKLILLPVGKTREVATNMIGSILGKYGGRGKSLWNKTWGVKLRHDDIKSE